MTHPTAENVNALMDQYAENQRRIAEFKREESRRKLDESYRRAASDVLSSIASFSMVRALLIPDVEESAKSFGRAHRATMLATLVGGGVIPVEKINDLIGDTASET